MDTPFDLTSFGLVALAGLLGGIIGLEREVADKPAGLRTHVFVLIAISRVEQRLLGKKRVPTPGTMTRNDCVS